MRRQRIAGDLMVVSRCSQRCSRRNRRSGGDSNTGGGLLSGRVGNGQSLSLSRVSGAAAPSLLLLNDRHDSPATDRCRSSSSLLLPTTTTTVQLLSSDRVPVVAESESAARLVVDSSADDHPHRVVVEPKFSFNYSPCRSSNRAQLGIKKRVTDRVVLNECLLDRCVFVSGIV